MARSTYIYLAAKAFDDEGYGIPILVATVKYEFINRLVEAERQGVVNAWNLEVYRMRDGKTESHPEPDEKLSREVAEAIISARKKRGE